MDKWTFAIAEQPDYDFSGTFDEVWKHLSYMVGIPPVGVTEIQESGAYTWELPTYTVTIAALEPKPKPKLETEPIVIAPDVVEASGEMSIPDLEALNAEDAIEQIQAIAKLDNSDSVQLLNLLLEAEEQGKKRKTVIAAINEVLTRWD